VKRTSIFLCGKEGERMSKGDEVKIKYEEERGENNEKEKRNCT